MSEPRKYSFMIWGFAPPISEAPIEYFRDLKLPELPATRAAVIRATTRFSGGSMQDQSTTGINEGASGKIADKNLGDIGPFTNSEIESVTRKCVAELGLKWDNLSERARAQYIEVTRTGRRAA
jgi:hypothetical protein